MGGGKIERSLAVLYFENLSGQKEDEYFRDGITEDITTEISKILEFRVFSRSAVLAYRDKPVTPSHVGQQLNATHIVEGSIRREADRLRITAKLVDTKTGHTLWAERYDRQLQHVFAIQDEIANSIAAALRVVLTEKEKDAIEKVPTADVRAYDFYLRGRHFFHQFRRKGLDLAREMFAHAIAIDPRYARAYAGIADCCAFLYVYWESSQANLEQADEASRKALELDPELAEAHASKGLSASLKKQYDEAQREFGIAIRLNPRLFEPYYFSGRNFYVQGKLEEAIRWFEQASRVLPEDYQALDADGKRAPRTRPQPGCASRIPAGLGRSGKTLGDPPRRCPRRVFRRQRLNPAQRQGAGSEVGGTRRTNGTRRTPGPVQRGLRLRSAG